MLARYQITRGKTSVLAEGVARRDIRAHRKTLLSPTSAMVKEYLKSPTDAGWKDFETQYNKILVQRFKTRRQEFDTLAEVARNEPLYIGCNCPTKQNPDVNRCHTVMALKFLKKNYPGLEVVFP